MAAIYADNEAAGGALKGLIDRDFDRRRLSVAARESEVAAPSGYYTAGGSMKFWGPQRHPQGWMWALMSGWAYLRTPDIGRLIATGPLVHALVVGSVADTGSETLLDGLIRLGLERASARKLASAVAAGRVVVLFSDAEDEVRRAADYLTTTVAVELDLKAG